MKRSPISRKDEARIGELTEALETIRLGADTMDAIMAEACALVEAETLLIYSVRLDGGLERWHQAGSRRSLRPMLVGALAETAQSPLFFYDRFRPPADQRNRVIEATAWIDRDVPGTWNASRMFRVMATMKLELHKQHRALLCDGPDLVAWFGAIHPDPLTPRQSRLLSALVPPMCRRLSVERRMQHAPRTQAALAVALDHLGAPAFVLGVQGELYEMSMAGRALMDERHTEVTRALRDAVAGRPTSIPLELFDLHERGAPACYLAIVRADSIEARLETCVRSCALRWRLTPRQTEVLGLVARGMATATIAATLGCGQRVVELHLTAIFDRADVESRASLLARLLTS